MAREPKSLQEAIIYFADPNNCREYIVVRRWPDGVTCPRCGSANVLFLEKYNRWHCRQKHAAPQFTLKTQTIFEDSPVSIDKWLTAMWMLCNCKNGVSSWEIHRTIKVTQKTAWFMLQRLRLALQDEFYGNKLGTGPDSEVEVDETYIGRKARNMHKNRRKRLTGRIQEDKTTVMGFLERGGRVRTEVVADRFKTTLQPQVRKHVEIGAALYTDAHGAYSGLNSEYDHEVVDHATCYVDGRVHTNTLENFWSLVKRQLHGTYVSVEPFHLFRYLDEQMFRFNNRATKDNPLNDSDRFDLAVRQIVGKRLTYTDLTGKESAVPF
jgi:transposase-like protein